MIFAQSSGVARCASSAGVIGIDAAGRVIDFNAAAERVFGRPAASVLGQPMHEMIIPPQMRQAHQDGMRRYQGNGQGQGLRQIAFDLKGLPFVACKGRRIKDNHIKSMVFFQCPFKIRNRICFHKFPMG